LLCGDVAELAADLVHGHVHKASPREGLIRLGDVRVVVLAVVDLHRPRVDVRLEGVGGVGEGGKRKCHGNLLAADAGTRSGAGPSRRGPRGWALAEWASSNPEPLDPTRSRTMVQPAPRSGSSNASSGNRRGQTPHFLNQEQGAALRISPVSRPVQPEPVFA